MQEMSELAVILKETELIQWMANCSAMDFLQVIVSALICAVEG